MQVSVPEAKANLFTLLREVQAGKDVVIAHQGTPVARLVRVDKGYNPERGGVTEGSVDIVSWLRARPLPAYAGRSPQAIEASLRNAARARD